MDNWIDVYSDNVFTQSQLDKRNTALIRQKYSRDVEDQINRMVTGAVIGSYVMNEEEQKLVSDYSSWVMEVQAARQQAVIDNNLLKGAIAYERAEQRLDKYILSVGLPGIDEVPEQRDPETGEIIVEYVAGREEIKPLPATVEVTVTDPDTGKVTTKEVPNPVIVKDEAERTEAQAVIDGASEEVKALVKERAGE